MTDIEFHVANIKAALEGKANENTRENARISLAVLAELAYTAHALLAQKQEGK
jgi:hypothetical protein